MGFFRCFQKKKADTGAFEKEEYSARTRSNSPEAQRQEQQQQQQQQQQYDEDRMTIFPHGSNVAGGGGDSHFGRTPLSPLGDTSMLAPEFRSMGSESDTFDNQEQLSRITEEPTMVSSTSTLSKQRLVAGQVAPPSAREAAFHGPPRFDWMDIETAAATKVQSVFRRNKVMSSLEAQGVSTSAIRNRKRRRKAAANKRKHLAHSQDAPSFLACCGVGLAFGDATEDDDQAYRDLQKRQYEERVEHQQMHENAIRKQYLQSHGMTVGKVVEEIEVFP